MPSHLVRRVAWGLVWRWSLLFASLITPAPLPAIGAIAVLLAAGLVTSLWRRDDLLGSGWRVLLAIAVINAGFVLGGALLVPAITLAIVVTIGDLWWSIAAPAEVPLAPVMAIEPLRPMPAREPIPSARPVLLADPVAEPRRLRSSRGNGGAGFRWLLAACMLVTLLTVGAFTMASRASAGLSAAIASFGQQLAPITAAVPATSSAPAPAASAKPTPSASPPDTSTSQAPTNGDNQPPAETIPGVDVPGVCVSLPDHRYEVRLPNGQVIVVQTHHKAGCPDLAAILKALQNASGNSD